MPEFLTPKPPRKLNIDGIAITILMSAADSGGAYGMIETVVPSGKGPPAHVHSREDETFYVTSGTAEFRLGESHTICKTGSCIFGPRGMAHGYRNVGLDDLQIVIFYTPGGIEESFQEWSDARDVDEVKEIIARYGVHPAI